MQILKSVTVAVCALLTMAAIGTATPAQSQQEPHYLAALSQLRTARDYIQSDGRKEFKQTKYAQSTGAVDPWAPIRDAMHNLNLARESTVHGVDGPANTGLRDRAVFHIDEARHTIANIMQQSGIH